jgi:NADPH:quinone reductase
MSTTTMIKAYQIHGSDDTVNTLDGLKVVAVPKAEPGTGELRICAEYIGLNRADILYICGRYLQPSTVGSIPGYEVVGKVDAVGSGVSDFKVGDRVSTVPSLTLHKRGVFSE